MHPWEESLSRLASWAKANNLQFDALGLVTFLGADEVNASVGRLVQSSWLEFLPLLGAFVIAGDRFTGKQPGFKMYNITEGIMTTEFAGWFSRWLKAQQFEQTRSIVTWTVHPHRRSRVTRFWMPSLLVGATLNTMVTLLATLSGDWFGLSSSISMIISVVVRHILVQQNLAGISRLIMAAIAKRGLGSDQLSEALVILDDSKAVTIRAPAYLIGGVFTRSPLISNPRLYTFVRWIGWLAFACHIVTLGSAALHTQIVTVVVIITNTILTCYKFGCDDSQIWASLKASHAPDNARSRRCWVGSQLEAVVTLYPDEWSWWPKRSQDFKPDSLVIGREKRELSRLKMEETNSSPADEKTVSMHFPQSLGRHELLQYEELRMSDPNTRTFFKSEGSQDLYVWLNLTDSQWQFLDRWDLIPCGQAWKAEYERKKEYFLDRSDWKNEKRG